MSNQGLRQASVRAVTGTSLTYEGDFMALFDDAGIGPGTFNGRFLAWINGKLGSSYTNINDAMAALAAENGASSFDAMGTFDASNGPDWTAYDGSMNGSQTLFFTDGGRGVPSVAGIDSTTALIAVTEGVGASAGDILMTKVTRDGTDITQGSEVALTSGINCGTRCSIAVMSSTRALIAYVDATNDNCRIALIDLSDLSVLDDEAHPTYTNSGQFYDKVIYQEDGRALWMANANSESVIAVTFPSDVITFGTAVTMDVNGYTQASIERHTDGSGFWCDRNNVVYYTQSGGTITKVGSANSLSINANLTLDYQNCYVDDNRALLVYENGSNTYLNTYLHSEGSVTRWSDSAVLLSGVRPFTNETNWLQAIRGERLALGVMQDIGAADGNVRAYVFSIAADGTPSAVVSDITVTTGIQADHCAVAFFPGTNYKYAICVYQEETTATVKQVGAIVMQA